MTKFDKSLGYSAQIDVLNQADQAYWVLNKPSISDEEYDSRLQHLIEVERLLVANGGSISPASPTQRLGGALLPGFEKDQHYTPMLSLANIFNHADLEKQLKAVCEICADENTPWTVEPKIDGLSLALHYEEGILVKAMTRGTGLIGDVVTQNVKTIRNVPLKLKAPFPALLEVRGEVFMPIPVFEKLNAAKKAAGEQLLANPRNAAAGALKLLDSREVAKRGLAFFAYHAIGGFAGHINFQGELLEKLVGWGFSQLVPVYLCKSITEVVEAVVKFEAVKRGLNFAVDGAVIKLSDLDLRRHFPDGSKSISWGWAYKYAATQVETQLKSVTWQVGRTGVVTPVAELVEVEIDGSQVERATLHNEQRIKDYDIRTGDTLVIQKNGMVIPGVVGVVKSARAGKEKEIVFPAFCPECSAKLEKAITEDGEGAAWLCPNHDKCPAQVRGRIEQWCGKDAMDLQDFGPVIVEKLVGIGVTTIDRLYTLDVKDLLKLPGVRETLATKLIGEIEKSKQQGLERVLVGLGIPHLGAGSAKRLAKHFRNIVTLLDATAITLAEVKDFGPVNIRELFIWKDNVNNYEMLFRIKNLGVDMESKTYNPNAAAGPLVGKTFVFTGTIAMERSAAQRLVESRGGRATGSVSKKTDFLVAGEDCGSKLDKAKALGVTILTEDAWLKMMEETA